MIKHHSVEISDKSFLVTGGAGFIGSNIVQYLIENGAKHVRVLDNLSTGFYKNIEPFEKEKAFEFINGDIRSLKECLSSCKGIDLVTHQAALGSVPRSIEDPITSNDVNVSGFLNILKAASENKIERVVYAASSSTYGDSKKLPKKEEEIGKPLSPYAVTKYVNELYADVFYRIYGLNSIGLRYFNVFGPKQDPNGAYSAVIPLFIKAFLNGQPPTINGDGNQTRDFTFVENAIQANINALLTKNTNALNQVYNVAYHERHTLNSLVELIKELTLSENVKPIYGPERNGDIIDSYADIDKAKKFLNYHPEFDLKDGIILTIDWFKNNKEFIEKR